MNFRARARKLFGRDNLHEHAVNGSMIDHAVLRDLRKRATKIDDALTTPPKLPSGDVLDTRVWERFGEDLFSEFYGHREPDIRARDKVDQRFRINRELADKQARDDAFRHLRAKTRGQAMASGVGLLGALDSFGRSYGKELAEHAERQNEVADAEDHLDSIDDMLAELRQQRQDAPDSDQQAIDQKIRDLAKQKREAVANAKVAVSRAAQHGGDLIDAAKAAVVRARESAEEAVEETALLTLPGKQPGAGGQVPPDLMLAFADRVHGNRNLIKVLEMLGRLDISMGNVRRTKRKGGFEEMVDIEMGNELALVLPHEKMLLVHPTARLDFYRRYHERSLMQYEMWSEEETKKGPVIVCADGSYSMIAGQRNTFCRGLTLATCGIANRENRNAAALEFGSEGQLREFWFPGNKPLDMNVALDFAEHFFRGGTDINQTLLRAHDLIQNEAPFHSADLLIITDGEDVLTDQTYVLRDALRDAGVKIHGIVIGATPTQYMVEVCDHVSSLFDFDGPNHVSDRIAIDLT